jgi:hypothetical protein
MQLPAVAGTSVSQPASQPTSSDVMLYSLPSAVLFCVLLFPHSTSFLAVKTFHHRILQRPTVRWVQWRKLGDVCAIRIRWQWSACLCNDDASNTRSIYAVFSLSVLNYSAKFRSVWTRALLRNPFLLLVQISVEMRFFFVHTCLSGIHVLLAVFFVYYCAFLSDLTFRHRSFTFNSNKSPTWCNNWINWITICSKTAFHLEGADIWQYIIYFVVSVYYFSTLIGIRWTNISEWG